jgi:hypothetical protein
MSSKAKRPSNIILQNQPCKKVHEWISSSNCVTNKDPAATKSLRLRAGSAASWKSKQNGATNHSNAIYSELLSKIELRVQAPSIFGGTFRLAKHTMSWVCCLSKTGCTRDFLQNCKLKLSKRSFCARLTPKLHVESVKAKLSCETSSKNCSWSCENELWDGGLWWKWIAIFWLWWCELCDIGMWGLWMSATRKILI